MYHIETEWEFIIILLYYDEKQHKSWSEKIGLPGNLPNLLSDKNNVIGRIGQQATIYQSFRLNTRHIKNKKLCYYTIQIGSSWTVNCSRRVDAGGKHNLYTHIFFLRISSSSWLCISNIFYYLPVCQFAGCLCYRWCHCAAAAAVAAIQ